MPLDPGGSDIVTYAPALLPSDLVSPIGGGISSTVLADAAVGALISTLPIPLSSASEVTYYYPAVKKNTNGTFDLLTPLFWLRNGLNKPLTSTVVTVQSDDPSETGNLVAFYKVAGVWNSGEVITLNGTTPSSGIVAMDAATDIFVQKTSSGGAVVNATGNLSIVVGVQLGIVPSGRSTATSFVQLGIDPAVNNTLQADNVLTPPTGVSFSSAFSFNTAIEIPGGANLAHTQWVKLWLKLRVEPGQAVPLAALLADVSTTGTSS